MPEAFDIGPLSWVKDEIDQSLKKVLDSFMVVSEKPEEYASLRFTTAHLYQVSGALDMVGLEGCKRYCSEIEKLTSKLEKQQIPVSKSIMADLIHAIDTLSRYLQDLLNGMPDTPTKLYESLKPLVELQGESLEISDLFYPDTSYSAPKHLVSNPIEESAVPIFVADQRVIFQKSLLDWLLTKSAIALDKMRGSISNVQQVQQKNAQKTLWWVATAFTDALAQESIAANNGAKKLCRRLDQQLRSMSTGEVKAPTQLLRDALYYVALSDRSSDTINSVKDLFELDMVLPIHHKSDQTDEVSASERAALAQLSADLPSLKDFWSNIDASANVDLGSDYFVTFLAKLEHLAALLQSLSHQNVSQLFNTIHATVQAMQSGKVVINEASLIEIAASFNLLEYVCQHYQRLDTETQQKLATQTARLQSILDGIALAPALAAFATANLDASVIQAVAKQIIAALKLAETALDTYFRDSANAAVLEETTLPLQQIVAAFDMLEMPIPKSIAQLSAVYVENFKGDDASTLNHSKYELLANSLSVLGLYTEELPSVRAETELALSEALQELAQGLVPIVEVSSSTVEADNTLAEIDADAADLNVPHAEVADIANSQNDVMTASQDLTDRAFDTELQDIFLTEVEEVLASLAQNLQTLRVNATDSEALAEVRRAYHTLKGSGRTVGLSAMSDVAWAVEKLLNLVMEHKAFPTIPLLGFIEKVSAAFATWVAELQAKQMVTLNPSGYQKEAAALEQAFEQSLAEIKPKPQKEEVLIGGTRTLSRAFFNIFLAEAQQHLQTLMAAQQALLANTNELPSEASSRAAHTLGSNALTAGFKPTGDLSRALEYWLDAHTSDWTEQHIALYGNVVKALADGLERATALKNPKSTRALIQALARSTAVMQALATNEAAAAVLELGQDSEPKIQLTEAIDLVPKAVQEAMNVAAQAKVKAEAKAQAKQLRDLAVDQELLGLFVEEARELVPQLGRDLRGWRTHPEAGDYSDSLQRALHTLKGSARMAGQSEIGDSVHSMEDRVIRALKQQVTLADFDEMFVEFDNISYMLEAIAGDVKTDAQLDDADTKLPVPARTSARKSQFLRMRADVLDRLINEAGEVSIMRSRMDREMQNFKQSSTDLTDSISRLRSYLRELEIEAETQMQSRMSLLQEANETFDPLEFDRFTRLQELTRMMAESVNDVATIQNGLLLNLDQTDAALQQQNRMNRELQKGLMGVRMLPFAAISERLQRIVRQTARELNKLVEMTIEGEEVELDRGVLDKMGAPLEHLLRNAVAHGLESTEQRIQLGKPETGQIKLKVSLENDEITLVVSDDGAGINLDKVQQKALKNGLISADQSLSDQALMAVIFEPGFTTADEVSQISGRGVGLDAVRNDITALSGRIDVTNELGTGAKFNIYLPVTLSVAQVVMVRVGNKTFAIPSVMVEQVQKLKQADLIAAYAAHKIDWATHDYPLYFLSKLIGDVDHLAQHHIYTPVILLRSGTYRTALHVDEIMGNQEVVMKQMGTQLARVPGMMGATVLGDGAIVLVINPVQLANREALSIGAVKVTTSAPVLQPVLQQVKKIALVVDDSLTMRKVLSRVLERENFEVITANDGMDAIQKLQLFTPDIILTDIEMPRMDGFEFSRYVRDNEKTSAIPLIIISSRTAEKHRNVAKELGVNAFLGKPVQDDALIEQVNALLHN